MISENSISYDTVNFLIVDDDLVSIKSIQRSIKQLKIANPVFIAKDGIEALEILDRNITDTNTLPPFIITLDLSMPRMGGLEFLDNIRKNDRYRKLVIFVLTTSDAPEDIASAYDKNIAGYIVKDNPTESLKSALEMIHGYARLVVLPR
ncbi:two-component system response regulator [Chromatiales bacterium (ex Bugula neritina AB1)]|nr:two-component system response regulator [Chromatiales bacterium (ex Bugula neritina AB1)]